MKQRWLICGMALLVGMALLPYRTVSQEIVGSNVTPTQFEKAGAPPRNTLVVGRLRIKGSDFRVDPMADFNLMQAVKERTNIPVKLARTTITLDDDSVFRYPFLFWSSENFVNVFTEEERQKLRRYLTHGGFLFIDDCGAKLTLRPSIRGEINKIFPEHPLQKIPLDHPLYHCYYNLDHLELSGTMRQPYHEGIFIDGRLVLVYTVNAEG